MAHNRDKFSKSECSRLLFRVAVSHFHRILRGVLERENLYRKTFAQAPNDPSIRDPYVSLVRVHENESIWVAEERNEEDSDVRILLAVSQSFSETLTSWVARLPL